MLDRLAAIALPALMFLALAASHVPPPERDAYFPAVDAACGAARLVLPPTCEASDRRPCTSCTLHTCRMEGDWTLEVRAEGIDPACSFEVRTRESGMQADHVAHWFRGGRSAPCARDGDALRCRLALDPVRLMSVALVGRTADGRLVNAAVTRVIVGRDGGLDIRDEAVLPTLVIALVALGLALGLIALARRMRWPDDVRALDRRRAALTAVGAVASLVLGTALPADVGGFDSTDPARLAWLVPIGALLGLALGPTMARARASYAVRSGSQRVALAVGTAVAALASSLVYRLAISENAGIETRVTVKHLFYATLGVALILPCVIYPAMGHGRALRVLGATVLGASVLGAVALATGRMWEPTTHQGLLGGFYKPPSAFTITLAQLPFLAALSVAVTVGRGRPPWLDGLVASLDGALVHGSPAAGRVASVRELARGLARRVDDLARLSAPAAAPLSYFAPTLIAPLLRDPNERAQLGLDADEATALERGLEVLIAARASVPYHEALAPGARLRVQAVPWPRPAAAPTLVVLRGGVLDDDPELRRRLAPRVSELASAPGLARLERGGYLVVDVDVAPSVGPPSGPGERLHIGSLALSPDRDSRMLAP